MRQLIVRRVKYKIMSMTIGTYLEKLRLSSGYSLRAAAKKTKLSHGYIRDVELGNKRFNGSEIIPMPQTLKKFADAYHASFNELMRIAGHIYNPPEREFEFIEIDLNSILYIEVDSNDYLIYHMENCFFTEKKALYDYILFEEKLENIGFLRIQSGLYVNLNKLKSYDKKKGRLYFSESMEGKHVCITWVRESKLHKTITKAIANNIKPGGIEELRSSITIVRNSLS
ncbi:LytTR family transcriptional regulator DNA-binding domain-containing protein [Bacillus cereus]|nr:LytTR family transcriptional regulator DNA-binding domain-containing protein [Bacillus cereus]